MWGGPVGYPSVHEIYEWSTDNQAEIDQGWVLKAGTLTDLAGKIGADAPMLEETVRNFNGACREGRDSQFGRPGKSLAPLETPPYYALELGAYPGKHPGRPKHNKHCQVLDFSNRPIRGCMRRRAGLVLRFPLPGGKQLPEAWAFGQIAGEGGGRNAPTLKSPDKSRRYLG